MTKLRKSFKIEEISDAMKKYGYYASEELQYNAFIGLLNFSSGQTNAGQDIFAVCLEGPPGAGKTEYAKTYTKLIRELWDGEVELVDYQCDATTGKTELFEDINISAAIRGDADNVNIPGKLIEAIKKVNDGKKIVLFIDEYDKAREETDAFLLQFLQSGKINSTQHGDLEIKPELKSNLQLILCKNDVRDSLSGPLSRRIRIVRLDYMLPETFFTVAKRQLIDDKPANKKVDDGILNLVSLMYSSAYDMREVFTRLPSCSEMLIAIQDADNLIKYANAPKHIVYRIIIENMFKEKDDIKTFESNVNKGGKSSNGTPSLKELLDEMRKTETEESKKQSLSDLIAQNVFKDETKKMHEAVKTAEASAEKKIDEATTFIEEYEKRFADLEKRRKEVIESELRRIALGEDIFVAENTIPDTITNFNDETAYVKRGKNIFDTSKENWIQVASATYPKQSSFAYIESLMISPNQTGIVAYENGFVIMSNNDFKLIMVRENTGQSDKERLLFYSNSFVVPALAIKNICDELKKLGSYTKDQEANFTISCLAYNEMPISTFDYVEPNVCKIDYSHTNKSGFTEAIQRVSDEIAWHTQNSGPQHIDQAMVLSKKLVHQKSLGKKI